MVLELCDNPNDHRTSLSKILGKQRRKERNAYVEFIIPDLRGAQACAPREVLFIVVSRRLLERRIRENQTVSVANACRANPCADLADSKSKSNYTRVSPRKWAGNCCS
jgi:hypothetical protein